MSPLLLRSLGAVSLAVCLTAQSPLKLDTAAFGAVNARAIGPATMSGRITSLAGDPRDGRILYIGSAGGGLWKTVNGGVSVKPIFDRYNQSIGAIALDPRKPETVWVGTGEPWLRNSVSVGNGIYRSTDAGENWQLMGLPNSERIARIKVDPKDSNTVYVAVLGKLFGDSPDRGLYKTTDAGKTWNKILYVDPSTGCADFDLDPEEPQNIYAAMWTHRRTPWSFHSGGKGSGLHRSSDGGKTWTRISDGMPEGDLGRIAVAVAPSRPSTVYALVEAKKTVLLRSDDAGRTWQTASTAKVLGERPFYFAYLVVDPTDYKRLYKPGLMLQHSSDSGKTFANLGIGLGGTSFHPDLHALWIDPKNPESMYLGTDGGVYRTNNRGNAWQMLRNLPVSQFYHVSLDNQRPFHVYGGLQDNGSWTGPSQRPGGVQNKDWQDVGVGDGFYVWPHLGDKNIVYSQYQGGKILRFHRDTQEIKRIYPFDKVGEPKLRFNWNTATAPSPTNPEVFYLGAQYLFRTRDRGESWERISPDLTTNDPEKQKQSQSGGLTIDNSSAENHCTIYTIAESSKDPRVIWAGTDDGNVQLTRDAGKTWTNLISKIEGAPAKAFVSSIEAGRHAPGTAYVTFDNHMLDDMKTYVFVTADYGQTWKPLATPDIKGYAHIVREDLVRPGMLFLGTEFGLWISLDHGQNWAQFTGNLPNVAVRDLAIHPRDHALAIATHGRGVYLIDDLSVFRQLTPEIIESNWTLLPSGPAYIRLQTGGQSFGGGDEFTGENPPEVAWITYWLKQRHMVGEFTIEVLDPQGQLVTKLPAGNRRGLNRVAWYMRLRPPKVPTGAGLETSSIFGPAAPEGNYTARLVKDGDARTYPIQILSDPNIPYPPADRRLQQTTLMSLYRTIERLGFIGAATIHLRDEAKARAAKLPKEDALAADLNKLVSDLDALNKTLAVQTEESMMGISGAEQIRERAGALYGAVSAFSGRPTQSQLDGIASVEKEIAAAEARYEALAKIDGINNKLKAATQAALAPLTREAWQKKQQ